MGKKLVISLKLIVRYIMKDLRKMNILMDL